MSPHPAPDARLVRPALALAPLLLALAGTASAQSAAPGFDPLAFFAGYTEGVGDMKVVMHPARAVSVHGLGTVEPDDTLVLDQTVERPGLPPTRREWRIRRTAPGRYAGSLSDAVGPVTGEAVGDRLHLRYRLRGGLAADQWLTLAADGRSARNLMRVRKRGMVVARLDETIRRTGS